VNLHLRQMEVVLTLQAAAVWPACFHPGLDPGRHCHPGPGVSHQHGPGPGPRPAKPHPYPRQGRLNPLPENQKAEGDFGFFSL
jgi:hypothetical protein